MNASPSTLFSALAAAVLCGCATALVEPAPVATATPAQVNVGDVVSLSGADSVDKNTPALPIRFAWSFKSLPPGSRATLNDPTLVGPSFVADVAGEYVAQLIVSNGRLSSAPAEAKVTAGPCGAHRPEVAEADVKATPASPRIGDAVLLEAPATDKDVEAAPGCGTSQTLSWSWWIADLPAGSTATLNLPTAQTPSFVADVAGAYRVGVVVTDSTGLATPPAYRTVTVTNCGGAAPTVTTPTATPAVPRVGESVTLTATASDVDNAAPCDAGQTLAFSWFFVALPTGSHAAFNDSAVDEPSFAPDLPGEFIVRARVTDSSGRSTLSAPVVITVPACGSASPVAGDVTATPAAPNAGQIVQLGAAPSDADTAEGCALITSFDFAWRITSLPAGSHAALNNAGATNPSFLADVPGDYTVSVVVTDSTGRASAPTRTTITVAACGAAAPTVSVTASTSAPAVGQAVLLTASPADSDNSEACGAGQVFASAWEFLAQPAGSRATLSGARFTPSFVPDVAGEYVASVVVTDSTGRASAPATVTVAADACGSNSPTASVAVSPASAAVGASIRFVPTASDADNAQPCQARTNPNPVQSLAFAWTLLAAPAGSTAAISGTTAREPSFTADRAGVYVARLVVTDSSGRASAPIDTTVTVDACGANAPVLSAATADKATPKVGEIVTLGGTFDDADNGTACQALLGARQTFVYAWRLTAAPAASGATLQRPSTLAASFTPDTAGEYSLQLELTDSTGRSARKDLTIVAAACGSAAPDVGPAVDAASVLRVGGLVSLTSGATDADNTDTACAAGQTLGYRWTILEAPAGSRARLSGTDTRDTALIPDVKGTYVVAVQARDSTGRSSAEKPVSVVITACGGQRPVAIITAPSGGVVTQFTQFTGPSDTEGDLDNVSPCTLGQALSYRWELLAAPKGSTATLLPTSTVRNPSIRPDIGGNATYVVRLRVTDSTGLESDPVSQTLNVP